jgi:hypothetical protein
MLNIKKQKGLASLLTSIIALLIMTISVFLVNRVTIVDILNSSAQIQSSKAREAAEAGVNFVLAEFNNSILKTPYFCGNYIRQDTTACNSTPANNATNIYTVAERALSTSGQAFTVQISRATANGPISIQSTGGKQGCLSGADCSKKTINVLISVTPLFSKMPPDAISSPGQIALTGAICVQNSSGNGGYAARAGTGIQTTNNLQGSGCAASNGNGLFGAVGTTDTNLSAMNGTLQNRFSSDPGFSAANESNYFQYLFGKPESYIYQKADTRLGGTHATSSASLSTFANSGSDCSKTCGKVIWVADQTNFDLGNGTYGSADQPVIIILNGTATISGSPTIYGMLYTSGSLQVNGNPTINGAVSIGGAGATGSGNLTVLYDASSFNNSLNIGAGFTTQGGSWRDW